MQVCRHASVLVGNNSNVSIVLSGKFANIQRGFASMQECKKVSMTLHELG